MKNLGLLIILMLIGCAQDDLGIEEVTCNFESPTYFSPENRTFISPSKGDFILSLRERTTPENITGYYDLDFSKICVVQENLGRLNSWLVDNYCGETTAQFDLSNYHYQFLGINITGVEHVYLNAFVYPEEDSSGYFEKWLTDPIDTLGGSWKYWGALFNLNTGDFSMIEFNSDEDNILLEVTPENNLDRLCTRSTPSRISEYFRSTPHEVCLIKDHFDLLKEERSPGSPFNDGKINFIYEYAYQYIGVTVEETKYVYINAAIKYGLSDWIDYDYWINNLYSPCDGGPLYWGVLFNLEELTFSQLQFNDVR